MLLCQSVLVWRSGCLSELGQLRCYFTWSRHGDFAC